MNPLIRFKTAILTVFTALACFALSPTARAQTEGDLGSANTAEGAGALLLLNGGVENTAIGTAALTGNTTGSANTATGFRALSFNNADNNTANGVQALFHNSTGSDNTATGVNVLLNNTTGGFNTGNGFEALLKNTTGGSNTANGVGALFSNTTGSDNTAAGVDALGLNQAGNDNTATGADALANATGSNNTADGFEALVKTNTGSNNTAAGVSALLNNTTGNNNIAIGSSAGLNLTTGSNNIDIGNKGVADETAKIRIGKQGTQNGTFIAGIHGVTVANALQVVVDVNGHLGTVGSSARFKEEIKPMEKASESLLALKPVTFRYKEELDPDAIRQFGLIAEEVEKVNPDLVARDEDGKVMTVRYEAVNAMLLNEFLKEHRKVEKQGATIAQMKKQIEALTATVQKVSEQLQLNKLEPQVAANN